MEEKIKTVAIFMGLFQDDKGFWGFKNTPERQRCHSDRIKNIYQYDRDWNLLMEVVEKIENFNFVDNIFWVSVCRRYMGAPIEVMFESVVEFINFYNKQKEE